jgi:hypothetical protein
MKRLLIVALLVLVAGGVAFTALGGMPWLDSLGLRGQERLLRSYVQEYWQARIDRDMQKMAKFEHPLSDGVADAGMLVTESFTIDSIEVAGDEAFTKLTLITHIQHPLLSGKTREVRLRDKWVRHEGEWYRDIHPTSFSDMIKSSMESGYSEDVTEPAEP